MTGSGSTPRTQRELIRSTERRLRGQERRLVPASLREGGRLGAEGIPVFNLGTNPDGGTLDDFQVTGWAQAAYGSGSPFGPGEQAIVECIRLSTGTCFQVARKTGATGEAYRHEAVRDYRVATGWSPWRVTKQPRTSFNPIIKSGISLGNGSISGAYMISDGLVIIDINVSLGSTSTVTADIQFEAPVTLASGIRLNPSGGRVQGGGTNIVQAITLNLDQTLYVRFNRVSGSNVIQASATSTIPVTWASGMGMQASWILDTA